MDRLMDFLHTIYPMSDGLQEHLQRILKLQRLAKNDYLLKVGQVSDKVYFVESGLVRCYYLKNKREICSSFMKEGDVTFSVESFYTQTPSHEAIQAIEDTTVYYITYTILQRIYREFPEFNFTGRVLTEHYYTLSEQRIRALWMQKSTERYDYLIAHEPELVKRVPVKYLASYLGLNGNYLSTIKSKI